MKRIRMNGKLSLNKHFVTSLQKTAMGRAMGGGNSETVAECCRSIANDECGPASWTCYTKTEKCFPDGGDTVTGPYQSANTCGATITEA